MSTVCRLYVYCLSPLCLLFVALCPRFAFIISGLRCPKAFKVFKVFKEKRFVAALLFFKSKSKSVIKARGELSDACPLDARVWASRRWNLASDTGQRPQLAQCTPVIHLGGI